MKARKLSAANIYFNPALFVLRWIIAFCPVFFIFCSCQTEEPLIVSQETPYSGIWTGNTSQMTYLQLEVRQIDNHQELYSIQFNYRLDSAIRQRKVFSGKGLFLIDSTDFTVDLPDGGFFTGKFHSKNHLSGIISVLKEKDSYAELHYSATHQDSSISINSISTTYLQLKDTSFLFEQVVNNLYPFTINTFGENSYIVGAGMKIETGMYAGTKVFQFNAGVFHDFDEISEFFTVGNKNFGSLEDGGIEVFFFDPEGYFEKWSTSYGVGTQEGSYFRILALEPVTTDIEGINRHKIMTEFSCKVYGVRGDTLEIQEGFFLGFVDLPKNP